MKRIVGHNTETHILLGVIQVDVTPSAARSVDIYVETEYRLKYLIGCRLKTVTEKTAGGKYKLVGFKSHVAEIDGADTGQMTSIKFTGSNSVT